MDYLHIWRGVKADKSPKDIHMTMPWFLDSPHELPLQWSYNGTFKWIADCKAYRANIGGKGGKFKDWNPAARPNHFATLRPRISKKGNNHKVVVVDIPTKKESSEFYKAVKKEVLNDWNDNDKHWTKWEPSAPVAKNPLKPAIDHLKKRELELTKELNSIVAIIDELEKMS